MDVDGSDTDNHEVSACSHFHSDANCEKFSADTDPTDDSNKARCEWKAATMGACTTSGTECEDDADCELTNTCSGYVAPVCQNRVIDFGASGDCAHRADSTTCGEGVEAKGTATSTHSDTVTTLPGGACCTCPMDGDCDSDSGADFSACGAPPTDHTWTSCASYVAPCLWKSAQCTEGGLYWNGKAGTCNTIGGACGDDDDCDAYTCGGSDTCEERAGACDGSPCTYGGEKGDNFKVFGVDFGDFFFGTGDDRFAAALDDIGGGACASNYVDDYDWNCGDATDATECSACRDCEGYETEDGERTQLAAIWSTRKNRCFCPNPSKKQTEKRIGGGRCKWFENSDECANSDGTAGGAGAPCGRGGFTCMWNEDAQECGCVAPSCNDNIQNGDESGIDCGGSCNTICAG
jgi:hypothetical protein